MKKLIAFVLVFICFQVSAQTVEETAIFDFSDPMSLNPSVTPSDINGGERSILQTFTENGVSMTFAQGPMPDGVTIKTVINDELDEDDEDYINYSLVMKQTSTMTVKVAKGYLIKSVTFSGYLGEVKKKSGEPGKWGTGSWDAGSDEVSQVVFQNNRTSSAITKVKVIYVRAATPLTLESTTPDEGSTISAFRSITLQFNTKVTEIVSTDGITLSGPGINGTMALTPSAAGKSSIALSIDSSDPDITTYGDYTVSVPEGAFMNSEGSVNEAIACTFKIDPIRTTLSYETVSPEEGTYTSLEKDIILSFGEEVSLPTEPLKGKMYKGNATKPTYSITLTTPVDGDQTKVMLTNSHDANITETGEWRIVIPEGAIHNAFYGDEADDRWNEEFTLTYTVNSLIDEKREEASALLAKKGLGYPASDSDGRTALSAAIADEVVTEESLTAAIDQFLAETDVTMPSTGKWYTIAGVNSSGENIYLTLSEDRSRVEIDMDPEKAAAFKATVSEGTVVFQTKGGKFLHVLTTLPLYDKTTDSNLTDSQSDVNNLTLAKFAVGEIEGVDAASLLGLFTIHGSLGTKEGEGEKSAYALLKYTGSGFISTDPDAGLKFGESLSSAFVLKETDEPSDDDPGQGEEEFAELNVQLSATSIKAGEELTLTISQEEEVTLDGTIDPYYTLDGQEVSFNKTILTETNTANSFAVNTAGLDEGEYELTLPGGLFSWTVSGKTIKNNETTIPFTVEAEEDVKANFVYTYTQATELGAKKGDEAFKDVDLNDLVLYHRIGNPHSGLVADPTKTVKLMTSISKVIRTGHFEPYPEFSEIKPGTQAIKLILDSPIEEGELRTGTYSYYMEAETFGDENFGKYLNGEKFEGKCYVNPDGFVLERYVNNAEADNPSGGDPGQEEEFAELNVQLSATSIKAGEELTLTISQEEEVTLDGTIDPYYTLDGQEVSFNKTILTKTNTANSFAVNTEGLDEGEYELTLPGGLFSWTVSGKTIKNNETTIPFTVEADNPSGGDPGQEEEFAELNVQLSATSIKAGEELTLTISQEEEVTLDGTIDPYYTLDGQEVSFNKTILTETNTANSFAVNTEGLDEGEYELTLPGGLFSWTVSGKTIKNNETTIPFTVEAEKKPGDVDINNEVDTLDLLEIISAILGIPAEYFDKEIADLNNDGVINIADIILLINIINSK